MVNLFARCFGRGKKGRRKQERPREEPTVDEPVALRYPLFDPRQVAEKSVELPSTPVDRLSSSPSVPQELDARENIILPQDEEEEEVPADVPEKEEAPKAEDEKKEEPVAPPLPEGYRTTPVAAPPPQEVKKEKEQAAEQKPDQTKITPPPEPPPPEERPKSPSPSPPSVSPGPPTTEAVCAAPEADEGSIPLSRQTQPPSSAAIPSLPPTPAPAAPNPLLTEGVDNRVGATMSPLEKLASARQGTDPLDAAEEAEAATAPCTPPALNEEGPLSAETMREQLERTRRLQQKLLALEEGLDAEELRLCHDNSRRRRKVRRKFPRHRVGWRCIQAAIDCYADAQDEFLEDIRMRLDAHEPHSCRICRNIDFSDVPLLP